MGPEPGDTFGREREYTADEVASFARLVGDTNPIHHDAEYARATRFGGRIVSGLQLTAELTAMVAEHLSRDSPMLGPEFGFRFRKAVPIEHAVRLEWRVESCTARANLGTIVVLSGDVRDDAGTVFVETKGRALVTDRL